MDNDLSQIPPELRDLPLKLVVQAYRRLIPAGAIPHDIEPRGIWTSTSIGDSWRYELIYWLNGQNAPLKFFTADITKRTLDVTVIESHDPSLLATRSLNEFGGGPERRAQ